MSRKTSNQPISKCLVNYCKLSDSQAMEILRYRDREAIGLLMKSSFQPTKEHFDYIIGLGGELARYMEAKRPGVESRMLISSLNTTAKVQSVKAL